MDDINKPDPHIAGNKPLEASPEQTLTVEDITMDKETDEERQKAIERDEAEKQRQQNPDRSQESR